MWRFLGNRVVFDSSNPDHIFSLPLFSPDWPSFSGTVLHVDSPFEYMGYDDWVQKFPKNVEIDQVGEAIERALSGERVHIRGVSLAESVFLIEEYFTKKGYKNPDINIYLIPPQELLSVSIFTPHALWCEKDKTFLGKKHKKSYGHISPPVRTPADLRVIQQTLRMGVFTGIESSLEYISFFPEFLSRQILSLYQIGFFMSEGWVRGGIPGDMMSATFDIPTFGSLSSD